MTDGAGHQVRRIAGGVDGCDIDRIRIRQGSDVGHRIGRGKVIGEECGSLGLRRVASAATTAL